MLERGRVCVRACWLSEACVCSSVHVHVCVCLPTRMFVSGIYLCSCVALHYLKRDLHSGKEQERTWFLQDLHWRRCWSRLNSCPCSPAAFGACAGQAVFVTLGFGEAVVEMDGCCGCRVVFSALPHPYTSYTKRR